MKSEKHTAYDLDIAHQYSRLFINHPKIRHKVSANRMKYQINLSISQDLRNERASSKLRCSLTSTKVKVTDLSPIFIRKDYFCNKFNNKADKSEIITKQTIQEL